MKYIRITKRKIPCRYCQGEGTYDEKVYHNQFEKVKCYMCDKGSVTIEEHTDVTAEVNELVEQLRLMVELLDNKDDKNVLLAAVDFNSPENQNRDKAIIGYGPVLKCKCEMPAKMHGKNICWRCKRSLS